MKDLKLYFRFIRIHMLSNLEYKGWWLMILTVLITTATDPIGTILLFVRFGNVGVWTVERILLIYALAVTSYGLAEMFFRGFDYFPSKMIQSGDFDRLLLRPRSLFVQAAVSFFHIHRAARPVAGIAVIIWCLWRQGVAPTPVNIMILVLALLGGLATYAGVLVMTSGIAFFTVKALDWIVVFTNGSYQVTRIPPDYMPPFLKRMFTFFMPMLVISYYPAATISGWAVRPWLGWLALPAGLAFMCASLIVWRIGVRHYQSTGS